MQTASMGPVPAALHCSWVSSLEVYPHWVNTSYEGYLDRIPLERMISIANELDALRWDILGGSTTTQQAGCTYKGPNASWLEDLIALFNSRWFYGHSLKKEMMIKRPNTTAKQCDYRKVSEIEWWWNMVSSSLLIFSLLLAWIYSLFRLRQSLSNLLNQECTQQGLLPLLLLSIQVFL